MTEPSRDFRRIAQKTAEAMLGVAMSQESVGDFHVALDRMFDAMTSSDRRQARAAFHIFNLSPLLYLEGKNFVGLDATKAERHLQRLGRSAIPPLRRLVRVLKTITAYAYYGGRATWSDIGYDGPWVGRIAIEKLPDPVLLSDATKDVR